MLYSAEGLVAVTRGSTGQCYSMLRGMLQYWGEKGREEHWMVLLSTKRMLLCGAGMGVGQGMGWLCSQPAL